MVSEIEFVCHNSYFPDIGTPLERLQKLYAALSRLDGAVPYMQDFSDDTHKEISLAVLFEDGDHETSNAIISLAKRFRVEIDIIDGEAIRSFDEHRLDDVLAERMECQVRKGPCCVAVKRYRRGRRQ